MTIDGRIKRMIVRPDGHNVFPSVIENLISTHYAVENSVVLGIKSDEYANGKIPTAFVVLKDEYVGQEGIVEKQLRKLSSEKLPPRDVALEYVFLPALMLTSVGKIDVKYYENKKGQGL